MANFTGFPDFSATERTFSLAETGKALPAIKLPPKPTDEPTKSDFFRKLRREIFFNDFIKNMVLVYVAQFKNFFGKRTQVILFI